MIDILARHGIRDYVYPVGRLDYESEGLLILTSDGDLAARLTHPSHGVGREYEVRVLGVPDDHEVERIARGVVIDGRRRRRPTCTRHEDDRDARTAASRRCCRS